jgi:hypothetical protein
MQCGLKQVTTLRYDAYMCVFIMLSKNYEFEACLPFLGNLTVSEIYEL